MSRVVGFSACTSFGEGTFTGSRLLGAPLLRLRFDFGMRTSAFTLDALQTAVQRDVVVLPGPTHEDIDRSERDERVFELFTYRVGMFERHVARHRPANPQRNLPFRGTLEHRLDHRWRGCTSGKTLFIEKCGGCHTMARANTVGTQGPDIDDSFRRAREDGMGDTIQGVVESQIKFPSQKLYPPSLNMPKDLVTGLDVNDVAAYVSYAAANPGKDSGALADIGGGTDAKGIFKTNCGSCHTLAEAGTSGTSGPNLDNLKLSSAAITKQIQNGGNGMPPFKGSLDDKQIADVLAYFKANPAK